MTTSQVGKGGNGDVYSWVCLCWRKRRYHGPKIKGELERAMQTMAMRHEHCRMPSAEQQETTSVSVATKHMNQMQTHNVAAIAADRLVDLRGNKDSDWSEYPRSNYQAGQPCEVPFCSQSKEVMSHWSNCCLSDCTCYAGLQAAHVDSQANVVGAPAPTVKPFTCVERAQAPAKPKAMPRLQRAPVYALHPIDFTDKVRPATLVAHANN